ncbi:hypothetical protein [Dokdonella sp.]|uniref:hypothetical protein n=1 Tax=Dokdonella sp. TaxID=2291710 RepID=UPI0026059AB4|nr:hypothetical protein [Dokdonella sp.]
MTFPRTFRACLGLASLLLASAAVESQAATLTVKNTGDSCSAWITGGRCLRAAVAYANLFDDVDRIEFDIPGEPSQYRRILLQSTLSITRPLEIDGYTQPGASPNTATDGMNAEVRIVIDALATHGAAFEVAATTDIRGLAIINTDGPGIYFRAWAPESRARGNYIGTEVFGTAAGNRGGGILAECDFCVIGGSDPADRNLISANRAFGIRSTGPRNVVIGNLIGTDRSGKPTLGNDAGVIVMADTNRVGDFGAAVPNVIAGNRCDGVRVAPSSVNEVWIGSLIFANAADSPECRSIALAGNTYVNDTDDLDNGANGALNHPEIESVRESGEDLVVEGRINSAAQTRYRVQLFANFDAGVCADAGGHGEGQAFLGDFEIDTPVDSGVRAFTWRAPVAGFGVRAVAATASVGVSEVAAYSTSPFSPCALVESDDRLFGNGFEQAPAPTKATLILR